jgi:predicted ATPase
MFEVTLFDETGTSHNLGSVKIGFRGQTAAESTYSKLDEPFTALSESFFSLGQDVTYYQALQEKVSEHLRAQFLDGLRDVVALPECLQWAKDEQVFRTSLLRNVSYGSIQGQFARVLGGGIELTDYTFDFEVLQSEARAGVLLPFAVKAGSKPSTNVHAIIGRNGVGKTTLLNQMVSAIVASEEDAAFYTRDLFVRQRISDNYFSSVVSVAFSAFDPFNPPAENSDPGLGTRYSYIGLKDLGDESGTLLKSLAALRQECVSGIAECFSEDRRRKRWVRAIQTLESDDNFATMDLTRLVTLPLDELKEVSTRLVCKMSSGHAVVLLTVSRLVARVEEKTLVILDEPESHLHPPLLSAFTRALSELLNDRNGVAIIATHSPVVIQEVPSSCVLILTRSHLSMTAKKPTIETFGENVGSLTREVFGLEVTQSGYHALLHRDVKRGGSYEEIVASYEGEIGLEARGILRAMIASRDASVA